MKGNKDPICGMMAKEEFRYDYKGQIFYFCSDLCKNKFVDSPESYLKFAKSPLESGEIVERMVAYFSMEIAINASIPTYSGGLGVLAGDTVRSCADLKVPMVAVTLLYKKGYFFQKLDDQGNQKELPVEWNPRDYLKPLHHRVRVQIEKRTVVIQAWQHEVSGVTGYSVPIIFLDTDLEDNSAYDRRLTDYLYGGDERYRLAQEIILGIGGLRMLNKLGYTKIKKYHMNEGHSSLLTLELLNERRREEEPVWDFETVRDLCVFTTHTPVPAGHDKFSYDLVKEILGEFVPYDILKMVAGDDLLNMTLLALNLSEYINGVAKKHGEISRTMFPGYPIDSITNGVHSHTWTSESFRRLYDQHIPGWAKDPYSLRYALSIPKQEIWNAHVEAKIRLLDYVNDHAGVGLDPEIFTIGFGRRATTYKRADFVFSDINRLINIANNVGRIQFVFTGKAHPKDWPGKELIKKIFYLSQELHQHINIVYLENYDMELGKLITSGVDLWLNTPQKPNEASGTSGMKAAHNGVPSLSVLDGWWIEGCIEGITGWSIGSDSKPVQNEAQELYDKLESIIIPMFYKDREKWINIMQHSIAINASFFNTYRMVQQYISNSYIW
ncbi:MAG: alpha-glucan family phosphorylase [Planctomycetota bacterium]|jgi:starch phosphorylase